MGLNATGNFSGKPRTNCCGRKSMRSISRSCKASLMGCTGAEGAAACGFDRRIHEDHVGWKQRGICKRLAAGRREDGRNRATRTGIEGLQIVENQGWRARGVELGA